MDGSRPPPPRGFVAPLVYTLQTFGTYAGGREKGRDREMRVEIDRESREDSAGSKGTPLRQQPLERANLRTFNRNWSVAERGGLRPERRWGGGVDIRWYCARTSAP